MTGPPASAAARSAGSSASIRPVTAARPDSTARHCAGSDPPGQARRGRGRQARHRGDLLARRVGALAVQPGQEVLPGQLRRRDPGQQLPGPEAAVPLLDRADRLPLAASPVRGLLTGCVCISLWITCAKRHQACVRAVEMLGIPLLGRAGKGAFNWEDMKRALCTQRNPDLSTRRAAKARK